MKTFKRMMTGLLMLLLLTAPVAAAQSDQRVFDDGGLFSASERERLNDKISAMEAEEKWNYYIVTTRDTGGKTARSFADDFYDRNHLGRGEDASGVLLLIDMDNREAYISTGGAAVDYYSSWKIDAALDGMANSLSNRHYYSAANSFLNAMDTVPSSAGAASGGSAGAASEAHTQADTETSPAEQEASAETEWTLGQSAVVSAFWAVIAVVIFVAVVLSKNRANRAAFGMAATPQNREQLTLTRSEDRFINVVTHTRRIQRSSDQSRSREGTKPSVHRSSSGVRHGGGGRKF